jgi:hypothetical protein
MPDWRRTHEWDESRHRGDGLVERDLLSTAHQQCVAPHCATPREIVDDPHQLDAAECGSVSARGSWRGQRPFRRHPPASSWGSSKSILRFFPSRRKTRMAKPSAQSRRRGYASTRGRCCGHNEHDRPRSPEDHDLLAARITHGRRQVQPPQPHHQHRRASGWPSTTRAPTE